ncbi:acetyl-acetyltransferase [Stylonychia lemnae]|uniref:acetyl-CoA C-acetyltransferase n=1 Tax=Stylonychia lemnae TaxID=5949 RepID=A0A078B3R7_STYLE|nr:acetyl-acetyltransferase [Stylonychia lemnae]|eukprot:CDW89185.1 acetyl-acetyltransferase [Stylonychia lemnae]
MSSQSLFMHSRRFFSTSGRNVVIVGGRRTAIGSFMGQLSNMTGPQLGSMATKGALASCHVDPKEIEEVYMGNVISAGSGQAPARQVALGSDMRYDTVCTTVNKVCASGMKAVMLGSSAIRLGDRDIVVAGGMESMSKLPHYIYLRKPTSYGHAQVVDSIQFDGLTDVYNNILMGSCTEKVCSEMGITREAQDEYAIKSYHRARAAQEKGILDWEIVDIVEEIKGKQVRINKDEECQKFLPEKFPQLKPAFAKNGTITAANSSKLNDGACSFILMSEQAAKDRGLKPLARILGYDDAEVAPIDFGIAPTKACKSLLNKLKMNIKDVQYHEYNEAFAAVVLANMKMLDIDPETVNVHGGAVALGHPIGMSGARIILSLINVLKQKNASVGMASICNGGGGASAIMIERLN